MSDEWTEALRWSGTEPDELFVFYAHATEKKAMFVVTDGAGTAWCHMDQAGLAVLTKVLLRMAADG